MIAEIFDMERRSTADQLHVRLLELGIDGEKIVEAWHLYDTGIESEEQQDEFVSAITFLAEKIEPIWTEIGGNINDVGTLASAYEAALSGRVPPLPSPSHIVETETTLFEV